MLRLKQRSEIDGDKKARPTTSQAPTGKRGRMERAQRQAAGRAATPFQTTRPPDRRKRSSDPC